MTKGKNQGLNLSVPVLRVLFISTLVGLWGALAIKCLLPAPQETLDRLHGGLSVAHGVLLIGGIVGFGIMLASNLSFIAQSADADLDERELAARNRAHYWTLRYVLYAVWIGWVVLEFGPRFEIELSREIILHFLMVVGFTGIVGPAGFLALQTDRHAEDEA